MTESPSRNRPEQGVRAHDEPLRRSVEVEYWVVDSDGRLCEPGELVDASPGAEREFVEPLLEIKTTPCETVSEMREELFTRVGAVLRRGEEVGKHLVPLATPLSADEIDDIADARTRIQDEVIGPEFEYVRHCAGTHVHFEQQPGRKLDQLNALVALDPALALVNSSPYFGGEEIATGARSKLYRRMAYDGLPHQGRLWRYVADDEEWTRRLERRYEEFVTAALEAGLDRSTVASNFDPESTVWTPVQLRPTFSTVEWRSPDTALPSDIIRLADDLGGVIERVLDADVRIEGDRGEITEDAVVLPTFDTVLGRLNDAIENGLESPDVRSYLDRMGFAVDEYEPVAHELSDGEITPTEARQIRLEHAERLARDVQAPWTNVH